MYSTYQFRLEAVLVPTSHCRGEKNSLSYCLPRFSGFVNCSDKEQTNNRKTKRGLLACASHVHEETNDSNGLLELRPV